MTGKTKNGLAIKLAASAALGSLALTGAADAQLKAVKTATSISPAERKQGTDAHPQLMAEFGGAYNGPQATYVNRVGQNIAVQSGLSRSPSDFTVTLLNSPVNNAFAIPGGYVYVTRQLMALMNDEAELAGVLGHEVGHVAAQHSKKRQSAATRNQILGVLGAVLGGAIGDNGGLLGGLGGLLQNNSLRVAQLATLGFSRSQELQADQLGVQYLRSAGYDPLALSTMLTSLANQTTLDARLSGGDARSLPEWASTHPDPASRVRNAQTLASRAGGSGGTRNADAFLASLDNVLYGDDPAQGVVEGRDFLHPDLKLRFTVPNGYGMQNGADAVSVSGNGGQAQFTTGAYSGDMNAYIAAAFRAVAGNASISPGTIQRTTVNGIPASYSTARVNTQSGQVDVTVFAYEFSRNSTFHFVTLTQAGGGSVFNSMFNSVRRLSTAEAAAIRPRRIDVVTVGRGDTVASLARRMAYSNYQTERFQVLNRLTASSRLTPGQRVKIVVYASR
ncbi:peptidase M48 Ste24p [Sphingopyxis sp. Root214]|uniref:M48 family metalloprotease n=1 Tax=unclassified Sphingopyxis TaxID=2614943 RepID=UPI0006FA009C|nr:MULTISPECIES: M48 family metalloprotease [unclassified Sphingopyxis]KQZ77057.1 peptidase M48 Ste24p [Sphingopyxis sp. Root154]KRC09057.1 peptidase M48 Ste24p [Sphingopyxis sp. Root214]